MQTMGYGARALLSILTLVILSACGDVGKLAISTSPLKMLLSGNTLYINQSMTIGGWGGTAPFTFKLLSGAGNIDSSTGVFTAGSTPGVVTIQVTDSTGLVFSQNLTVFGVPQVSYAQSTVNLKVGQAMPDNAVTNTGGPIASCSLDNQTLPAGLKLNSGTCQITGAPTAASSASYTITVTNPGGSSTATITIGVYTQPQISFSTTSLSLYAGQAMTSLSASNSGGQVTSCSVSKTLPAGLSLDSSCTLSGTPTTATDSATYVITASNPLYSSTANMTIVVYAQPTISYPSTSILNLGQLSTISASNSGGPIASCTLASSSAALPAGLSLSPSNCAITGTPTVVSTGNYTVIASNPSGQYSLPVSITIQGPPVVGGFSGGGSGSSGSGSAGTVTLPAGVQTVTTTLTATAGTGASAITSCTTTAALPTGVTVTSTASSCIITIPSGTTLTVGTISVPVTAHSAAGNATLPTATIIVQGPPVLAGFGSGSSSSGGVTLPAGVQTVTTTLTASAGSGTSPITSCTTTATLPTGVTVTNTATSCIVTITSGATLTAGVLSIPVTAHSAAGSAAVATATVTAIAAPHIANALSTLNLNQVSSIAISNTGGLITGCAVGTSSPALPSGLSVNPTTCAITGTPSIVGTGSYTIVASNLGGQSSAVISITVQGPPVVGGFSGGGSGSGTDPGTVTLPAGVQTVTTTMTASSGSGTSPITSCTTTATLPTGIVISNTASSCSITIPTGTTLTAGTISVPVTAHSAAGNATLPTATIIVQGPPVLAGFGSGSTGTGGITLPAGVQTVTTTLTASAGSGTSPITSCTTTATLPSGMTLSNTASSCILTIASGTTLSAGTMTIPVTAHSAAGSGTVTTTITVIAAPHIAYSSSTLSLNVGQTATTLSATDSGGPIASCAVTAVVPTATATSTNSTTSATQALANSLTTSSGQALMGALGGSTTLSLPAGLTLNSSNCTISGSPTAAASSATYTVTATNAAGSSNANITIAATYLTQTCNVTNGVGIQNSPEGGQPASACVLTMCNPGFIAQNGTCVAETASNEFTCTSYQLLVLNSSGNLVTSTGADIPGQDASGSGVCYYYPIVNLTTPIQGSSTLTGAAAQFHDQDVVARDHDANAGSPSVVWHPYIMNHTTLNMNFAGARTLQLTGGSLSGNVFTTSAISIDNFFLIGVYPKDTALTPSNLLSFYSAWGTGDSTVANSSGVATNGIAFNPAGINLTLNGSNPYSTTGVATSSAYSIVPLKVEASGGTAAVPSVSLTNLIDLAAPTTIDFRALDCGGGRYLGNIYLLFK
jgi:hypothetical protein